MIFHKCSGVIRLFLYALIMICFLGAAAWSQQIASPRQTHGMQKKSVAERKALTAKWKKIMKQYPEFARMVLAQQIILMEIADREPIVRERMCGLLSPGVAVLFEDHWVTNCPVITEQKVSGVLGCLTVTNRDPAGCIESKDEIQWFDDPTGRYGWPPKLPPTGPGHVTFPSPNPK